MRQRNMFGQTTFNTERHVSGEVLKSSCATWRWIFASSPGKAFPC